MPDWPNISSIAKDVNEGKMSALSQVEKALKKIEELKEYDAVISVLSESAINKAKDIDKKVASGKNAGRLAGVPFIAKDNFLVLGSETTAGSNILKGFNPPYQATCINLLENEGAICVAKANLDAFAHGSSTENSDFMVTKNPMDKSKVAGGSSGGSSASVALGMVPFALGTDTGGSVRMPASLCGVVGYKPSYGIVSRNGIVSMASSIDCVGAMTAGVEDLAIVMEVMTKRDELDSTTIDSANPKFSVSSELKEKPKIGVVKEYLASITDKTITDDILEAITRLKKSGYKVEEVSLPSFDLAMATYYVLVPAEVSSNLSRYDGIRYGFHADNYDVETTRSEGFGAEAKRRIIIGTFVLSSGYYDAYYRQAQLVRTKIVNEFKTVFNKVDYLLAPTTASRAFNIGEKSKNPLDMYLTDVMTSPANLSGIPAISIPLRTSQKLPSGLQLMGRFNDDYGLINLSRHLEEIIR